MKKNALILALIGLLCPGITYAQMVPTNQNIPMSVTPPPQYRGVDEVNAFIPSSDAEIAVEEQYYSEQKDLPTDEEWLKMVAPKPTSVEVDTTKDLTDVIASSPETQGGPSLSKTPTWINKLTLRPSESSSDSLESMVAETKKVPNRLSNASVFDISGVMLRMSKNQVEKTLTNRGYKKTMERSDVPNFVKWRNEEKCRAQGVVGYERLANCVLLQAKKDGHEFIEVMGFAKYDTQEEIEVRFTSNFTNNKAYKIVYQSLAPMVRGNSQKSMYIRNIKVYDFWKKINQKYGAPDDKTAVRWGLGNNKPYLSAKTGQLLLEDPMLRELDYTRMSREDQRYMNTNMYNF